jgi:hypothetical protein
MGRLLALLAIATVVAASAASIVWDTIMWGT